jgi:hypothetical protein
MGRPNQNPSNPNGLDPMNAGTVNFPEGLQEVIPIGTQVEDRRLQSSSESRTLPVMYSLFIMPFAYRLTSRSNPNRSDEFRHLELQNTVLETQNDENHCRFCLSKHSSEASDDCVQRGDPNQQPQ